jgi:hypothetical protein
VVIAQPSKGACGVSGGGGSLGKDAAAVGDRGAGERAKKGARLRALIRLDTSRTRDHFT